jgi:hypothetical protein
MAESVTFSPEVAKDLILPVCVGFGYRVEAHTHDGYRPYDNAIVNYDDPADAKSWVAIQRMADQKVFVAELSDWRTSPYVDSAEYYEDGFGGVILRGDDERDDEVIVPTPDVTFKEAIILHIPNKADEPDFYESDFAFVK